MIRTLRRINPFIAAVVVAAALTPSLAAAQGGTVRGYFDFFDNMCYPCTGSMETNPYCTCQAKEQDAMMMQVMARP